MDAGGSPPDSLLAVKHCAQAVHRAPQPPHRPALGLALRARRIVGMRVDVVLGAVGGIVDLAGLHERPQVLVVLAGRDPIAFALVLSIVHAPRRSIPCATDVTSSSQGA